MKFSFLPKSRVAKTAMFLFVLQLLCLAFFFVMITVFNQRGGETFFSNLWLTAPMLMAWTTGIIACVLATTSLIKDASKSLVILIIAMLTLLTSLLGILQVIG